jgi:hypothetical protein
LFKVTGVVDAGCDSMDWTLAISVSGLDSAGVDSVDGYYAHTVVTSGGLVYMNQKATASIADTRWGLYASNTYGPTTGTWPIAPGQPMKVVITVERPLGNVLSSWTMVARSCDAKTLLYNGLTSSDGDGDYVDVYRDRCPELPAYTSTGCPAHARALSLARVPHARRIVGRLSAPGFPSLYAGRAVAIWKAKRGRDTLVATRTTDGSGAFGLKVRPGTYYATSAMTLAPRTGQASAGRSHPVSVR